jgi:hypothetical protein
MDNPNNKFTNLNIHQMARMDFDRAHFKSFVHKMLSLLRRTNNDLLPFDEIRKYIPLKGQHDIGYTNVKLDLIIGSVGRYQDFDRAFLPKMNFTRDRWENIDRARMKDIPLPPVELYKIGEIYFVKDGNHRVSVARELGQAFIDAYVTEIKTNVALTPDTNPEELILQSEYVQFLERTALKENYPDCEIRLTQAGQYEKLMEHIQVHRWYMGEKHNHPIDEQRAARSWYKKVYLPLVQIVRDMNILADFPGRSEADLYLWIIEHQYFLTERSNEMVPLDQAALHFVNRYSRRPLRRLRFWLDRIRRKIFSDPEREHAIEEDYWNSILK